jgi:hypothetical protein
MPTRLAAGLEAKKSSSDFSDAPRVLRLAKLWFPRVVFTKNNFGDLICISLYKITKEKARKFYFLQLGLH